ncbi:hypothetical protein [Streptomyces sp. NPDC003480]
MEDFAYANADQILRGRSVKLIKGDGHITLASCDDWARRTEVLTVQGRSGNSLGHATTVAFTDDDVLGRRNDGHVSLFPGVDAKGPHDEFQLAPAG